MSAAHVDELFEAIEAGTIVRVEALLDADPGAIAAFGSSDSNRRDKTPLMYALQCNRFELARLLMKRGADVCAHMAAGPGSSVISLAVRFAIGGRDNRELVDIVGELIDRGADPNDALWPACHAYRKAFDQPELIELLLRRGADPDRLVGNAGASVRRLVEINAARYSAHVLRLFGLAPTT